MIEETAAPWRAQAIIDFTRSALFDRLFQDGMDLVDETAAYLDGAGRQDARVLPGAVALAYGAESMRLTSRLTRLASWLLVQRAVRRGDLSPEAAEAPRFRIAPEAMAPDTRTSEDGDLPVALLDLIERSGRLLSRALNLDRQLYRLDPAGLGAHPVGAQLDRLRAAFGG